MGNGEANDNQDDIEDDNLELPGSPPRYSRWRCNLTALSRKFNVSSLSSGRQIAANLCSALLCCRERQASCYHPAEPEAIHTWTARSDS